MRLISERKEKSIQYFEVEVPQEKVSEALSKAFRKVASRINVPGFRKGKAPRSIIERHFGESVFYDEAIDMLLPEAYSWIIEEFKPDVLDQPRVDVGSFKEGVPAIFEFAVPVKPDVILGTYKGIAAEKPKFEIGEAEVTAELLKLQQQHARLVTITEGAALADDNITLDFEGYIDDEAFEGGKGEDYSLILGSGRFIPGFEDSLIGQEIGVPIDVQVTFPEDYQAEHLAGKPAVFKCLIKDAKRKELMPIDDEFAEEISEFATLDEWKENLLQIMTEDAEQSAEEKFRSSVLEQVAASAQMDLPNVLVERQIDRHILNFRFSLMQRGISLEDYMKVMKRDENMLRDEFRETAANTVHQMLTIDAIAKTEQVEPSDEDMKHYYAEYAAAVDRDVEEVTKEFEESESKRSDAYEEVRFRKTVELIVNAAVILEPSDEARESADVAEAEEEVAEAEVSAAVKPEEDATESAPETEAP